MSLLSTIKKMFQSESQRCEHCGKNHCICKNGDECHCENKGVGHDCKCDNNECSCGGHPHHHHHEKHDTIENTPVQA